MEKVRVEREIGGQTFSLETGFIAKQAGACVIAQYGDTVVLNAVTSGAPREGIDFLKQHWRTYGWFWWLG